jgi:hypothetical protein
MSTSVAKAEYYALAYAGKEAMWIRSLLGQLGFTQDQLTTIYRDNQGALAIAPPRPTFSPGIFAIYSGTASLYT